MAPAQVEFISPLLYSDTDAVCHLSRVLRMATCTGCNEPVYGRVHMPLISYGLYCSNCCPCRTVSLTAEEEEAIRTNQRNSVKQARCGAAIAKKRVARWDDPENRRRHGDRMREFWASRKEAQAGR